MNKRRHDLVAEFKKNPILLHPVRFDKKYKQLQW